jgi:hypothetical protein
MNDARDKAEEVRAWLADLELTDAEGADSLCLRNRDTIMREYKDPKSSKMPSDATRLLMETQRRIVDALVEIRTGKIGDARHTLESTIGAPLMRRIHKVLEGATVPVNPPPSVKRRS